MTAWTCACGATNDPKTTQCEDCGERRVRGHDRARAVSPRCPFDGGPLADHGWCQAGDGWPITRVVCPIVCDRCRTPLTWAGTCNHCLEYAPGDRYEYTADNPHWRRVEKGPFTILPIQEQTRQAAEFAELMARLAARTVVRVLPAKPLPPGARTEDRADRGEKAGTILEAFWAPNATTPPQREV